MKKYIFIATIISLCAALSFLFYGAIFASAVPEDPVKLEDAIIIHGIEMDSDEPQSDAEEQDEEIVDDGMAGKIIYNDEFDDAVIDYEKIRQGPDSGSVSGFDQGAFDKLRKKDRRWYLSRYMIKKNDNLWKIARRFGVHPHLLISVNEIKNPDMLRPGRTIQVPSKKGIYYTVRKGDSVSEIASRYSVSGGTVINHNGIVGGLIRPGQKIFLPGAREAEARRDIAAKQKKPKAGSIAGIGKFIWPLRGRITSGFGTRKDPLDGRRKFHCGIDISANVGTRVRASKDGRVIFSGWKSGYGNVVIMRHDGGYITVYAHNSKNLIKPESHVKRGDTIALSGMTGAVTGAHLHFEIRKYVNPLNPLRLLSR
ncbi:MAG: M23 family metallopeptidase [Spirochaetes bacterium]|nr:M23 family metallopeptidase [Spirochaetota bacterium]